MINVMVNLLLPVTVIVVSLVVQPRTSATTNQYAFATRIPRGGTDEYEYTAVGVIVGHPMDSSSAPPWLQQVLEQECCLVVAKGDRRKLLSLPMDSHMLETLSASCQLLVLSPSVPLASILEGVKRRRVAECSKLKIIVVLPSEATQATREQLVLQELQQITPEVVDSLELVTASELASVWEDLVTTTQKNELIEEQGLLPLIKAIYESLSSKPCELIPMETHKAAPELSSSEIVAAVLSAAQEQLNVLEAKLEDVWLNSDSVPILEFGIEADVILQQASDALNVVSIPPQIRLDALFRLCRPLKSLYDDQLQSLREHYGKRYENVLDSSDDVNEWTQEAARATEAFRAAAQQATPKPCRQGGELVDADFSYVMALQGLIADMMEATSGREDLDAVAAPEDVDEESDSRPRRVKWYEKLTARGFVLAVNYLQGWMAWKAIQRAAVERDREMPKFPLF